MYGCSRDNTSSVQKALVAGLTLKSSDTKPWFKMRLCSSDVKCSGALNIREQPLCEPYKSTWLILLKTLCNIPSAFIASVMDIYILSTQTCRDSSAYTHTHTRTLRSVFLLAKDFFPESKIIQFLFFLISLQYIFQFCLLRAWNSFSNGNICFVNQICIMHRMQSTN